MSYTQCFFAQITYFSNKNPSDRINQKKKQTSSYFVKKKYIYNIIIKKIIIKSA